MAKKTGSKGAKPVGDEKGASETNCGGVTYKCGK